MADDHLKKLEAAIRYYNNSSNTVYYIDPALILDFDNVENFDFKLPHSIVKVIDGKRTEVPVQVFGISDDREELENPGKRRIFSKKRSSDVLNDIKESREKGKSKSGKSDRNHEKTEKPQNQSKESKETSAQLKAMQKKMKEDAKAALKINDRNIMDEKLEQRGKLDYAEDCTEQKEQNKRIHDLEEECYIKSQQIQDVTSGYEAQISMLEKRIEESNELLRKSRLEIESLLQKNCLSDEAMDSSNTAGVKLSFSPDLNNHLFNDRNVEEPTNGTKSNNDDLFQSNLALPTVEKNENISDKRMVKEKRKQDESLSDGLSDDENKENKKKKTNYEGYDGVGKKPRKIDSCSSDSSEKKNEAKRRKKYTKKPAMKTRYDSSSEDSDGRSEKIDKKRKKRYSRASDDEYLSDLFEPSKRNDFKSYKNKKGIKMMHLKHDVTITYKCWSELKSIKSMKEYMRVLLHSIYEEEVLRIKVFKMNACQTERIPGEKRSQFSRRKITSIRKTFFAKVELSFKDIDECCSHISNWKVYISEHINALVGKQKRYLKKQEEAGQRKKELKQSVAKGDASDSLSISSDEEP